MTKRRSVDSHQPSKEWRWRSLLWAQFVGLAISMMLCWHSFDEALPAEQSARFLVASL